MFYELFVIFNISRFIDCTMVNHFLSCVPHVASQRIILIVGALVATLSFIYFLAVSSAKIDWLKDADCSSLSRRRCQSRAMQCELRFVCRSEFVVDAIAIEQTFIKHDRERCVIALVAIVVASPSGRLQTLKIFSQRKTRSTKIIIVATPQLFYR